MGYRFYGSKKFMPAGLVFTLATLMVIRFGLRFVTGRNYFWSDIVNGKHFLRGPKGTSRPNATKKYSLQDAQQGEQEDRFCKLFIIS